ncbi:ABC transporter permease subunit [Fictibacillus nanhaiensis]|uniref:ABC transporter permease subunit n=1 Tax=Fictibacillus nanhaiensis TaxID=742169 RepID=UPI002E1EDDB5|nr:ABC transporter permease subunit [Fictibacillus nanhaiensis]MED1865934.1 ABC transporter permease subunit [Fictibacillus nanhaiensis]
MRKLLFFVQPYLLLSIGVVLLSATPSLFAEENTLRFSMFRYGQTVIETIVQLTKPHSLTLYTQTQTLAFPKMPENRSVVFLDQITERPLFPEVWGIVTYTTGLILASFTIAVIIALVFGWVTELLPSIFKRALLKCCSLLESMPDLFFVFCIQLFVVWLYKQTGWLAANPFTSSKEPALLIPLITLSIVPGIYMYRIHLLLSETEMDKDYITFARSKGISKSAIILKHLLSNILSELSVHFPIIILLLFSQMVVLEYLFRMNGVIKILLSVQPYETKAMLLLLVVIPLFAAVKGVQKAIIKRRYIHAE